MRKQWVAWVVRFMVLGVEINGGGVRYSNDEVVGGRGKAEEVGGADG